METQNPNQTTTTMLPQNTYCPTLLTRLIGVVIAVMLCISNIAAQTFEYKDASGLYYLCDDATMEAVVIACKDASADYEYQQNSITIPATITITRSSIGEQGATQEDLIYKVSEIGENALKNAWAFSVIFAENSNVRIIRKGGMYGIGCSGTLTLPASLRIIEQEGIYVKSSAKAKQFISEIILPAGLEKLDISSIVLNKLQTLQFMGAVPPICETATGQTACNPFTAIGCNTPEDVTVLYPDGCFAAYKNAAGIGDYFTCFTDGEGGTTTDIGIAQNKGEKENTTAKKVMINGQVVIVRNGEYFSLLGNTIK